MTPRLTASFAAGFLTTCFLNVQPAAATGPITATVPAAVAIPDLEPDWTTAGAPNPARLDSNSSAPLLMLPAELLPLRLAATEATATMPPDTAHAWTAPALLGGYVTDGGTITPPASLILVPEPHTLVLCLAGALFLFRR